MWRLPTFRGRQPAPPRRRALALVGLLASVLVLVAVLFDWNWLKGPLERRVQAATGRSFEIDGDLDVDLGWTTTVRAGGVRLGNAPWSKQPQMASAEQVELRVVLLSLLGDEVKLPAVHAQRPRLLLERDGQDRRNWSFDERQRPPERQWLIDDLSFDDGELELVDVPRRTDLELRIDSGPQTAGDARRPLIATGSGRYAGAPFELHAQVDSPLELQNQTHPFRVDARARAGATTAHARGELSAPFQTTGFDVQFEIAGADLADLYRVFELALPPTPPYQVRGRLRRERAVWYYDDFEGRIGDSDVAGHAMIDGRGERTLFRADVTSQRLDLDDLAGLFGAPPDTGAGETASAEQEQLAAARRAQERFLPDTEYDLPKLRFMDVDLTLRAASIESKVLPLESGSAHARLERGLLQIDPLAIRAAGGRIAGAIRFDARSDPIASSVRLELRGIELPKLIASFGVENVSTGRLGGLVAIEGQGNSVARIAATADGELGVVMGRGTVSNLLVELAGIDIAEALRFMVGKDRRIPIRCAYAQFAVADGTLTTRALVFDTSDSVIYGEGGASLRDETLDLDLEVQPKDRSPFALRAPLHVGGTFKDPSFRPQGKALILRGAAAAILYSLVPPAALLATMETGPGADADCTPATGDARIATESDRD